MRNLIAGLYYTITSAYDEESLVYCYVNTDMPEGHQLGLGFNIADGGGFLPLSDLNEASRVTMTFGQAIDAAKQGYKVQRAGWNGKNMFIVYMPPLQLPPFNTQEPGPRVNDRTAKYIGEDTPLDCQPYFAMFNAQKQWIPGWLASQSDMLADDWQVAS